MTLYPVFAVIVICGMLIMTVTDDSLRPVTRWGAAGLLVIVVIWWAFIVQRFYL